MLAMHRTRIVSLSEEDEPLSVVNLAIPEPTFHEVLIKVSACGVFALSLGANWAGATSERAAQLSRTPVATLPAGRASRVPAGSTYEARALV